MEKIAINLNLEPDRREDVLGLTYQFPATFDTYQDFLEYLKTYDNLSRDYILESFENGDFIVKFKHKHEEKVSKEYRDTNNLHDPYYDNVSYYINKYSFRGANTPDIIDNNSVVCGGCSITFGQGCYDNEIWPVLAFGENAINLGHAGDSAGRIIRRVSALLDFKKPKAVVLVLPTLHRIDYFLQYPKLQGYFERTISPSILRNDSKEWLVEIYKDYINGTSDEYQHLKFFTSLELIIQKCERLGIKLFIGSWHKEVDSILRKYSSKNYNYFDAVLDTKEIKARDGRHPGLNYHKTLANTLNTL